MKKLIIPVIFGLFVSACSIRSSSELEVQASVNSRLPQSYSVKIEFDDQRDADEVAVLVIQDSRETDKLRLSRTPTTLLVRAQTLKPKFRLFKDHPIQGTIVLQPVAEGYSGLRVPFSTRINSWVNTHYWVTLAFLGSILLLAIVNFVVLYAVKVPANGCVEILYPGMGHYNIYPRSRWFHLYRDRCVIGSGENDDVYLKDIPGIKPGQIVLRFHRQRSGARRVVAAQVRAPGFLFKDEDDIKKIASKTRQGLVIYDYILEEGESHDTLKQRNYLETIRSNVAGSNRKVYANRDLVIAISMK